MSDVKAKTAEKEKEPTSENGSPSVALEMEEVEESSGEESASDAEGQDHYDETQYESTTSLEDTQVSEPQLDATQMVTEETQSSSTTMPRCESGESIPEVTGLLLLL